MSGGCPICLRNGARTLGDDSHVLHTKCFRCVLFAAAAVDEIAVAIDVMMDGDYTAMKAHGVMRNGKRKNKCLTGTNGDDAVIHVRLPLINVVIRTLPLHFDYAFD